MPCDPRDGDVFLRCRDCKKVIAQVRFADPNATAAVIDVICVGCRQAEIYSQQVRDFIYGVGPRPPSLQLPYGKQYDPSQDEEV